MGRILKRGALKRFIETSLQRVDKALFLESLFQRTCFSCIPRACLRAYHRLFSMPAGFKKDLPTSLHLTGLPARRSGGKSSPFRKKGWDQYVFSREKTSFYFPAGAAAGDSEAK
ncbi:MAG: hypothetical protein EA344_06560 [Alkalicoccus sp.]|nr:MAG: hypothetical protein EA344_06560 [Alkalicoccus sp.]